MKHWLLGILLLFATHALAQESPVIEHELGDDGLAYVPLQFPFPYYGQVFTDSWMSSNGLVMFMNPYGNTWCCQGNDLTQSGAWAPSYSIMPLWTDLVDTGIGKYLTQGNEQYQRYFWENIAEFYDPNKLNTFGLEILPNGSFSQFYSMVNISSNIVTIGNTGNLQNGEFEQLFYGGNLNNNSLSFAIQSDGMYSWFTEAKYGTDPCIADPLSSSSCPGYEQAYFEQQCSVNPLYDSKCPGYEQAYFEQQCSLDALYNSDCSGYEQAYFEQQCSINPLYDSTCPGYDVAYILQNNSLSAVTEEINNMPDQEAVSISEVTTETITELTTAEPSVTTETVILETATKTESFITEPESELTNETETKEKTLSPALLKLALSIANQTAGPAQTDNRNNTTVLETQQVLESSSTVTNTDSANIVSDQFSTSEVESDMSTLEKSDIALLETDLLTTNMLVTVAEQAQAEYAANATDLEQRLAQDTEMVINSILANQFTTDINAANSAGVQAAFTNNNMQQVLAMGGTITQILNTPVPDYSKFEIKPPSQEEQTQTARVENTLESMNAEDIEDQAELRIGSMDPEAQTIALQLIGYKPGFDQYGGVLADQSNWYLDRSVYTNNRVPSSNSNQIFGAQDQRHQELMSLQYRR